MERRNFFGRHEGLVRDIVFLGLACVVFSYISPHRPNSLVLVFFLWERVGQGVEV